MNMLRALAAAVVLGLAGCGSGGVQSPDFTPVLDSLAIDNTGGTFPVGRRVALTTTGQCTTPPGSDTATADCEISPTYTVSNASIARIEGSTLIGLAQSSVTVTASKDGKTSDPVSFSFTAPVLDDLAITPATDTVALGTGTRSFRAQGIYSNSATPRDLDPGVVIKWTSGNVGIATVTTPGITTTASPIATGTVTLTAAAFNPDDSPVLGPDTLPIDGTASLTVNTSTLTGLDHIEPANQFVTVGASSQPYVAFGSFSSGPPQALSNDQVDWSSLSPAIGTIVDATGVATGVAQGQAVIQATLSTPIANATNTVTATLSVTSDVCTTPFLTSLGATVSTPNSGLLCPILCSVNQPLAAFDSDSTTFSTINVPLALLTLDSQSLVVTSPTTVTPDGVTSAGVIIGRPAGALLSAEVLAALTINTLGDTGQVIESFPVNSDAIRLTLLGTIGGEARALLAFVPTQAYKSLSVTFNGGVASALSSTDVLNACATVNVDATP